LNKNEKPYIWTLAKGSIKINEKYLELRKNNKDGTHEDVAMFMATWTQP